MRALIYKADFRGLKTFYRRLVTDEVVVPRELYRGISYVSLRAFIAFKIIYSYLISRFLIGIGKYAGDRQPRSDSDNV